jgi:hypothetical protein
MSIYEQEGQSAEAIIRKVWTTFGLEPRDLPGSDDPRMQVMVALLGLGLREAETELARLRRREEDFEERLSELEARVGAVEEQIGLTRTLQ